jgi:hypothetical protein
MEGGSGQSSCAVIIYNGLTLKRISFFKQEDISAQVDHDPYDGAGSEVGLADIEVDQLPEVSADEGSGIAEPGVVETVEIILQMGKGAEPAADIQNQGEG